APGRTVRSADAPSTVVPGSPGVVTATCVATAPPVADSSTAQDASSGRSAYVTVSSAPRWRTLPPGTSRATFSPSTSRVQTRRTVNGPSAPGASVAPSTRL